VELTERLKRRNGELRWQKDPHIQTWRDCADWTFPVLADGLHATIISASDTQSRKARILDATAPDGCRVGSASLQGAMIPANAQWFGIDIGEEATEEESAFLDAMAKFMWQNLHASNFDAESFDAMVAAMVFGWFVLYEDAQDEGGYHFELWPIGQCAIGSTRTANLIDTVYREFELTVAQTVAEYGEDKVSSKTLDLFRAHKLDDKVRILHAIEPRGVYAVGGKQAKNLPFSSCHMEIDGCHLLRESGYHEFPCMVPRWSRLPNSVYATGPMSDALPHVRTVNELERIALLGLEVAAAGMWVAEDDGVLNAKNIRMGARKILVANSVDSIKRLDSGARPELAEDKAVRIQGAIRRILLADQLPPADGPVKTAYEWSIRVETMRKMLGPMFARYQSEFLQSLIERTFGITWRANEASGFALVGRPPESLLNRNFSVRYLSPLARAQRLEEVSALDRYEMSLAQEAQIDPSVLDVYLLEDAARERGHLLGIPAKLMRDQKSVDKIRTARAEAQAQQQQAAMAAQGQVEMQGAMAQRVANAA
jgi:hypothetical protein